LKQADTFEYDMKKLKTEILTRNLKNKHKKNWIEIQKALK